MAAALGSVVVELSANIVKFESGLKQASSIAENQMKSIDKSLGIVKTSLGVLGAGFLANATFDKIKDKITGVIESAANLQKISEQSGIAASQLSGLAAVAKLSSTDTGDLATGLQKLSKSMIDAENGGKKTGAAFAAIGISTQEIKNKNPGETFQLIAERMSHYQDGAEKLVIAQALLGKSGANLIPVLKDLADVGDLQIKVTDKQAKQALEYEQNLTRFKAASEGIYKVIALELVPVLNDFVKNLIKVQTETGGITDQAKKLAKDGSLREFFEDGAIFAATFLDTLSTTRAGISAFITGIKLAKATFGSSGDLKFGKKQDLDNDPVLQKQVKDRAELQASYDADLKILSTGSDKYEKKLRETFDQRRRIEESSHGREARGAPVLEKIKANGLGNKNGPTGPADDPAKKELEGKLKAQENFIAQAKKLAENYQQDLDFYVRQQYITEAAALDIKKSVIEQELAAEEAGYKNELKSLDDYSKLKLSRIDRADNDNRRQAVLAKQLAAEADAAEKIGKIGKDRSAIQRDFDLSTEETVRQQNLANEAARFQIDLLGKSTLEVQKLTAARQIQLALEETIRQSVKRDADGNVSGAITAAAQQQITAAKLIDDSFAKQQSGAFGASEALRKYGEDAANTGAQIESSLTGAFKSAEDALVSFATTGKLSFSSLAQSVIADLARMQAKAAISGLLNFLGNAIGNAITANTYGTNFGSEQTKMLQAQDAGLSGSRAVGGPVGARGRYLVGENGPEILTMGGSSGNIIPNGSLGGGGGGVTVNVYAQPGKNTTETSGGGSDARRIGNMIGDKVREVILQEKRNGGLLTT